MSDWLEAGGFKVLTVSRGRDMIMFSGTAAQVERAFRTPIHRYRVNGKEHHAAAGAPSIPTEMADLVEVVRGMDDFRPSRRTRKRPIAKISDVLTGARSLISDGFGDNLLVPADIATIYNLGPIYQAGIDGTGMTIAIPGDSDIDLADIQAFRKMVNLPVNDPVKMLVPKTRNPGMIDSGEPDLDLEWSGAIAPKATILYVFSGDPFLSTFYAIDQRLAPVLSTSYGVCEWHLAPADFNYFHSYSQKAAAEGITWVSSSGDSGAAGCEDQNGAWSVALTRMSAVMPASLPEVTAVGGLEFNEGKTNYWSNTPGANSVTATGYIPETAWNDESLIIDTMGFGALSNAGYGFAAGGGGASIHWPKPAWQTGAGVPDDGARDLPDIALNASPYHDAYMVASEGEMQGTGGTSASAPVFAGMVALLNQYLVSKKVLAQPGLGNINPMLYSLAQSTPSVYHDITTGSNIVPCQPGSTQDCGNDGTYGYSAGPGYDLVTGWGSVDAANLMNAWPTNITPPSTAKLVITKFTMPSTASVLGSVTVDVEVQNQGTADAPPFEIAVLFSTDGTLKTALSWYIFCDGKSSLAAGAGTSCTGTLNLNKTVVAGTWIPIAVADYKTQVAEWDRSGNVAFIDGKTLTVK